MTHQPPLPPEPDEPTCWRTLTIVMSSELFLCVRNNGQRYPVYSGTCSFFTCQIIRSAYV